ncbi:MAG: hypothetical protein WCG80_04310 [Spirochaetales bacterium]
MTPDLPTPWVMQLSETLFWDVDQTKVDANEHRKWLLERVLERGFWNDWILVSTFISREQMVALLPKLRLQPREAAFLRAYLGGPDAQ